MRSAFITAYMYSYGATKKEAARVYRDCLINENIGYIEAIIDGYYNETKKAFYED